MPTGAKDQNKPKLLLSMSYLNPTWWLSQGDRPLHSHDFCEVMFVKKGSGKIRFAQSEERFETGDVVVYNPGTMHAEFIDNDVADASFVFIGISNLSIDGLQPGCLCAGGHAILPTDSHYDAMFFYLDQMFAEKDQRNTQGLIIFKDLLNIIIANVLRLSQDASMAVESRKTYTQVKQYIDENFTSIGSIDKVCKDLYINKYYFTHLFTQRFGISPLQYLIKKRMSLAKYLLASTDKKIDVISLDCGYDDVAYFCRMFKKQENVSPLKFRKLHRNEQGK